MPGFEALYLVVLVVVAGLLLTTLILARSWLARIKQEERKIKLLQEKLDSDFSIFRTEREAFEKLKRETESRIEQEEKELCQLRSRLEADRLALDEERERFELERERQGKRQPLEEEAGTPKEPEPPQPEEESPTETPGRESKRVDLIKRGGRPRGPEEHPREKGPQDSQAKPRFGIVCKKWDWQWYVGLELPEELEGLDNVQIRQGSKVIDRNTPISGFWTLTAPKDPILVQWSENGDETRAEVEIDKSQLVFKLDSNQETGRLVKTLSYGSFAVFVPETWQRDENESGQATVEPERAAWPGYKVHFFDFQPGETPRAVFVSEDGLHQTVSERLKIDLTGNLIPDVSESVGPLFAGSPPILRSSSKSSPQIKTIVIGEEGPVRGGWRTSFSWEEGSLQQDLPGELAERGANWYFVRLYDAENTLVGTLDFRFVPSLRSVQVQRDTDADGKSKIVIEFLHEPDLVISPVDSPAAESEIMPGDGRTTATLRSHAAADEATWLLCQERGTEIKVTVDLSTICWGLSTDDEHPYEWHSHPMMLFREMFMPTSPKSLWVRFPRANVTTKALAGFRRERASEYRVSTKQRTLRIDLRDFSDADEILQENAASFHIWWEPNGESRTGKEETTIATIPRRIKTRYCLIDGCMFSTADSDQLYEHLEAEHDKFRYLELVDDYDKFLTHYRNVLGSDWPKKIYRCGHCDEYVRADDGWVNPGDAIWQHLMDDHSRENHTFRIVTSVEEIRKEVIASLPKLYRCKYRDAYIEDINVDETWGHLLTAHRDDFVRIEVKEDLS